MYSRTWSGSVFILAPAPPQREDGTNPAAVSYRLTCRRAAPSRHFRSTYSPSGQPYGRSGACTSMASGDLTTGRPAREEDPDP
jgi:hypothetical protein